MKCSTAQPHWMSVISVVSARANVVEGLLARIISMALRTLESGQACARKIPGDSERVFPAIPQGIGIQIQLRKTETATENTKTDLLSRKQDMEMKTATRKVVGEYLVAMVA